MLPSIGDHLPRSSNHIHSTNDERSGRGAGQEQNTAGSFINFPSFTLSSAFHSFASSSSSWPTLQVLLFSLLLSSYCCIAVHGFTVQEKSESTYSSEPKVGVETLSRRLQGYREYMRKPIFTHPLISPCSRHEMQAYCDSYGGDYCYRKRGVSKPLCKCRNCFYGDRCQDEDILCFYVR